MYQCLNYSTLIIDNFSLATYLLCPRMFILMHHIVQAFFMSTHSYIKGQYINLHEYVNAQEN
jgi:hypothetical protein